MTDKPSQPPIADQDELRRTATKLLRDASEAEEVDHQACVAYLTFLAKHAPQTQRTNDALVEQMRKAALARRGDERGLEPEPK